ncbi:histidine ammonia-lyase [Treponema phagedenis]|uniref:Histidine ammonia-lyase n=1 Tax=Treponema phagedenis TaxID=162 RepID=A0AAE6M7T2_TREPH|nr:histidine ammonia-lyase [Treponema phagedenis]NVP24795.1 histidine ammonia-lyase [Treponema phagedenis]QEJ98908.1 histidine ammonia-lyase [Treponema phagedenis]QEK04417.1 histidine ammonia-lyase [Treponema phagedenis]QEK10072.1 histidine ammonia-lyase [Treponema phagedenis]QKS93103.1 histidine ammonia-lyase [Treponema phagedenis]
MKVILSGNNLDLEQVIAVARNHAEVELDKKSIEAVEKSRKYVEEIVEEERVVYGINTGFGSLSCVSISKEDNAQLQENLIRTHASGFGDPLGEDEVRAVMLIRINSLLKGVSGIRLSTVETLLNMLNKNLVPFIPEKGSLGASGDLAPLAHMVLPMLGLGKAYYNGELLQGGEAMKKAGIPVIKLAAKEGLALINGTTVLTAIGALALYDAINLAKIADIAGAMSLESARGIIDAFYEELHVIRPHKGSLTTAKNLRELLADSGYITHTAEIRVQDSYTFRCMPQVHGASKDTLNYVKEKVEIEINSATDNPIITQAGQVISGGNFHGELMAQPFDFLAIAASEIGNISERRIERLVNTQLSKMPSFLVKHPGLNSGFMITQYAAAALASENKTLSHPASVDSIPSCENQEDFVSMGQWAARKAREVVKNATRIIAAELMIAAQALDFRKEMEDNKYQFGKGTGVAYKVMREFVNFIEKDDNIEIYDELEKATDAIRTGKLLNEVSKTVKLEI